MYSIRVLQNAPSSEHATIRIKERDKRWHEAYSNWLANKNPTDAPDWKQGVHLYFEPVSVEDNNTNKCAELKWKLSSCLILSVILFMLGIMYFLFPKS